MNQGVQRRTKITFCGGRSALAVLGGCPTHPAREGGLPCIVVDSAAACRAVGGPAAQGPRGAFSFAADARDGPELVDYEIKAFVRLSATADLIRRLFQQKAS